MLNFMPFQQKLTGLTDQQLQGYGDSVPAAWNSKTDICDRITDYLREARDQAQNLLNFVKHLLR